MEMENPDYPWLHDKIYDFSYDDIAVAPAVVAAYVNKVVWVLLPQFDQDAFDRRGYASVVAGFAATGPTDKDQLSLIFNTITYRYSFRRWVYFTVNQITNGVIDVKNTILSIWK